MAECCAPIFGEHEITHLYIHPMKGRIKEIKIDKKQVLKEEILLNNKEVKLPVSFDRNVFTTSWIEIVVESAHGYLQHFEVEFEVMPYKQ